MSKQTGVASGITLARLPAELTERLSVVNDVVLMIRAENEKKALDELRREREREQGRG